MRQTSYSGIVLTNKNTRFREAGEQGDCIASECWRLCSKTGWLSDAKSSESRGQSIPPPQWKRLWQWLHLLRGSSSCWTCDHGSSFCWATLAPGLQDHLSALWPSRLGWQCLPADFWVCSPFSGFWTGTYFLLWVLFVFNIGVVSSSWLYTDWHSDWDKTKKKKSKPKLTMMNNNKWWYTQNY